MKSVSRVPKRRARTSPTPRKSTFRFPTKITALFSLVLVGSWVFNPLTHLGDGVCTAQAAGTPILDNWWPVDGVRLTSVQPFKALVENTPVTSYTMYWQVDGGQRNKMSISYQDAPHYESLVDLTSWTWDGTNPYKVTFVAVDNKTQKDIAQKSLNLYKDGATPLASSSSSSLASTSSSVSSSVASSSVASAASSSSVSSTTSVASSSVSSAASSPVASSSSSVASVQSSIASSVSSSSSSSVAIVVSVPASSSSVSSLASSLNVWWPSDGAVVGGTQPFKVQVPNLPLSSYTATWNVDGGQANSMYDSTTDAPHKEAQVNVGSWTWKGTGPYMVTFTALDSQGHLLAQQTVSLYTGTPATSGSSSCSSSSSSSTSSAPQVVSVSSSSAPTVVVTSAGNNPLAGAKLYVDPNSDAKKQADAWRTSQPADAAEIDKIAQQPSTFWFGNWNWNVQGDVQNAMNAAASQGAVPVLVAYNIPNRDCGGYSSGGAADANAYKSWIGAMAAGIGGRKSVVILEPDATSLISCLSPGDLQTRWDLLKYAVQTFKAQNASVYIDAGHPGWISASDMAGRLQNAGLGQADGFALNISNFNTDDQNKSYGTDIANQTGGKHFIVDTGRNGLGPTPDNQWCNPSGRALGRKPTTSTDNPLVDAYLWVKGPGGSDGQCNGGPAAGIWWGDYALGLAQRAAW